MSANLALLATLVCCGWLIRRDIRQRSGVSGAIWIPTLWVGILASRSLSAWVGFGGAEDTLEGSPLDRTYFFVMILLAFAVTVRRGLVWSSVVLRNWLVFGFYGFLLFSVLWANSPFVSFKRWFKEAGNLVVLMVILTEADPRQAFRAVFVRCAYMLIPLSIVFIRYFPDLGRRYSAFSGQTEPIGVACQKNSLGTMVLTCGVVLIWDWYERSRSDSMVRNRFDRWVPLLFLGMGVYLLRLCDSKTSILCLLLAGGIMLTARLPLLRQRLSSLGLLALVGAFGFVVLDQIFGVSELVVRGFGRDMTFTGRTEVWRELLKVNTDPVLGTGFMSFWDNASLRARLPEWVAASAHNGYVEIYLAGGIVGVFLLAMVLVGVALQINQELAMGGDYGVVRLAIFVVTLAANFTESNFAAMTPVGFLFLLVAIGHVETAMARSLQPGDAQDSPMELCEEGKAEPRV